MNNGDFDIAARAAQNHLTGNINVRRIPGQLRPIAAEMARRGDPPYALVTMSQQIMHNIGHAQPAGSVAYTPTAAAYTSANNVRHREW